MRRLSALSLLLYASKAFGASPPVKVWLRSSWPAPDVLLEAIETIGLEIPDHFFAAFNLLTSPESRLPLESSPAEAYSNAIALLSSNGYFSEPALKSSFELSMALHSATPKIEAFYQYYRDHIAVFAPECASWVEWYGSRICNGSELEEALATRTPSASSSPKLLAFDHVFPAINNTLAPPSRTAILYASLHSPSNLRDLHNILYAESNKPDTDIYYVIRYTTPPPSETSAPRNFLSGYGVALDLKKMDYLALDDRRGPGSKSTELDENTAEAYEYSNDNDFLVDALRNLPELSAESLSSALNESEVIDIGFKATQLILSTPDPLHTLQQLSQNFPQYTTTLARRVENASGDVINDIVSNSRQLPVGFSGVWINGLMVPETDMNPFGLLRILRKERQTVLTLTQLGLSPKEAVSVLAEPSIGRASSPQAGRGSALEGYFDASDRIEGGGALVWWNDIEKDSRYARWSPSLVQLMRGGYPGQFLSIRRNLNNIVAVLDLSLAGSAHFITVPIPSIIQRGLPFRFGVVPIVETEEGLKAARLLYYLVPRVGRTKTIDFFHQLVQPPQPKIDLKVARQVYKSMNADHSDASEEQEPWASYDDVVGGSVEEVELKIGHARAYNKRLSTTLESSAEGHAFLNGKHFEFSDDFLRVMQADYSTQTQFLQEQLYTGVLQDDDELDMSTYFYDLPTTAKRRNKHIFPSSQAGGLKIFNMPELFDKVGLQRSSIEYLYPTKNTNVSVPLTVWIIGDLDDPSHAGILKESLKALDDTTSFRLSFLHVPRDISALNSAPPTHASVSSLLYRTVFKPSSSAPTPADMLSALEHLVPSPETSVNTSHEQLILVSDPRMQGLVDINDEKEEDWAKHQATLKETTLLARAIGLQPSEAAIIINGRVVGPIEKDGLFAPDFEALCAYELQRRVSPVSDALNQIYTQMESFNRVSVSEVVSMVSSVISAAYLPDPSSQGLFNSPPMIRQQPYLTLAGEHTSFQLGDNETAVFHVGVIVDPISVAAQKWSPLLRWLSELEYTHLYVLLVPQTLTEVPLKRFYRENFQARPTFDQNGSPKETSVVFTGLPEDPIYTLAMEVPPSWLVRPRESQYDLDNIHLSSLSEGERLKGVEAVFDLDFIVIEGHAREPTGAPPRGLQLQLTSGNSSTAIADTLVAANLGYLQFRATPGVFQLQIRPGRGREVYEMESVGNEGWNSPPVSDAGDEITLTSFEGLTLYPRIKRLPGQERAEVLDESGSDNTGVLSPVLNWVKSFSKPTAGEEVVKPQAEINIFTVASGLLYERFVGIMILSVLKNTNSTVKFWFIENFLSPSFLEFIPHLAEAYGFDYELVTYKWPSWLRAQTEKQRVIWAYKILFLDVLFPMDLKKVIFVDADQIVRADLKELVDLDLEGHVYGYTPMGDDNVDMEGFRFWKTGYWAEYLRGKPYHISALYVIDLVRFRQLAAGDRLRGQYQGLSADPNSLANLDQDLPNHLQHDIPIYSLDKNWLWCETWCSKDRFDQAKTIDLCQNPLTKEPKLARARQIPEWEAYDAEIANFAQKMAREGKIKSHAAGQSVSDLASIGKKTKTEDEAPSKENEEQAKVDEKSQHTHVEL